MKYLEVIGIFVVCAVIVGILLYVSLKKYYFCKKRRRAFEELFLKIEGDKFRETEVLFIDLQRMKMRSSKYFEAFQWNTKTKTLSIKQLSLSTGFDFFTHYHNIISKGKEEFREEYDMYVNGEKLHFIENGAFVGCYIASKLRVIGSIVE